MRKWILVLGIILAACGGGGEMEGEEPKSEAPRVDCEAKPELCK